MIYKLVVIALLVLIVVSLFMALASLVRGDSADGKTVRRLGYRVGLSALLILFLMLASFMGWIKPHGLPEVAPDPTDKVATQTSETETVGKQ